MNQKPPEINASLMTFNIAHGRGLSLYQGFHTSRGIQKNLDRIARIIAKKQPDVVALQEVDRSSHWNQHINLLDYLKTATQYPYAAHGVHNSREGRKPLSYGNAFLSKYPIKKYDVHPFGERTIGEKGFMQATFATETGEFDVINLHLDFRSRKTRIQQVERILEKIDEEAQQHTEKLPPIICGDFNTSTRGMRDALQQLVIKAADHTDYRIHPFQKRTFPAHFPSRGLDFILLAKPFISQRVEVVKSYASDHLPVILEFSTLAAESQSTAAPKRKISQ